MRTPSNTVLAGVAALALLGGASFASAQQQPSQNATGGQQSTQSQAKQPQAKQPMKMNQAPSAGQQSQNTTAQKPRQQSAKMNQTNKTTAGNKQAARTKHGQQRAMARSKKAADRKTAERGHMNRMGRTAEMRTRNGRRTAAQERYGHRGRETATTATKERNGQRMATQQRQGTQRQGTQQAQGPRQGQGMQGLQGNASGMNVQLNDQQRTQIRDTVLNARGAPRVGSVNFDVTVGSMVPRGTIHVMPVPQTLVRIEPRWRGLRYFVYEHEVVIVNPRDMRIVAVVPV
jgi:hypothetical protein